MKDDSDAKEGYVYVLGVKDIDLPVSKIGMTSKDPTIRCAEINRSSTGDFLWEVAHQIALSDCRKIESLVHAKLLPLRQKGREFFNLYPDDALRAIQSILKMAPDVRLVATIAESQKEGSDVPRRKTSPRKHPEHPLNDTIKYAHLLDRFNELLHVTGEPFGQLNKPVFGISDGRDGVQWNLAIRPNESIAEVGVNLEGKKYYGWPIATLIKSELAVPALLRLVPHLRDPQNITLRFVRDAWQVTARPSILEEYLGGRKFSLSELTEDLWHNILTEAIGCLKEERNALSRAHQNVTLVRKAGPDAEPVKMQVSPHLQILTPIDLLLDSGEELAAAIECLRPIHEWASKVSGE
ncbi:GIY-YIG nuclease family protein [Enterobacter ludwigii]